MNTQIKQYCLHDIYDHTGTMLVKKGALLTEELQALLRQRNITYKGAAIPTQEIREQALPELNTQKYFLENICDRNGCLMIKRGTVATQSLESLLQIRQLKYRTGTKSDLAATSDNETTAAPCECPLDDTWYTDNFTTDTLIDNELANELNDLLADDTPARARNITDVRKNVASVATKIPFLEYETLAEASTLVAKVLNASRNQTWGLHINALANYVDWTYSHSINVTIMSVILAKQINLSQSMIHNLVISSILHDIGMVIVPRHILESTGGLSAEDKKLIKEHPRIGYHMLLNTTLPQEIILPVLQHHERIDGCGYPSAIPSKEISPLAKILRIADTFDSITSDRPYHKASDVYAAISMMKQDSNKEFDPYLFTQFGKLFKI